MQKLSFLLFCCTAFLAQAAYVFDAHRLFQLERDGSQFGSQRSAVNLAAATLAHAGSLHRHIVMFKFEDFNMEMFDEALQRGAEAIGTLLPQEFGDLPHSVLSKWRGYEEAFLSRSFEIPIYFCFEDESLNALYAEVKAEKSGPHQHQIVGTAGEPTVVKDSQLYNLKASLVGSSSNLPKIVIAAHLDSFSAVSSLSRGSRYSATGLVGLLELARLLSKLYKQEGSAAPYDFLFVVSSGSSINYAGIKQLISKLDSSLVENIQFALCLENLADHDLRFIVSRPGKEEPLLHLYQSFSHTAEQLSIPFQLNQRKINLSNPEIDFPHEHFSRNRIAAGTLTSVNGKSDISLRNSIFDTPDRVNSSTLSRNVLFLAESLVKHIHNLSVSDSPEIFAGSLAVSESFIDSWLHSLSHTQRVTPFYKQNPLVDALKKTLSDFVGEDAVLSRSPFPADEFSVKFFEPLTSSFSAYKIRSSLFDATISLSVGGYLLLLWLVLLGPSAFFSELKNLFLSKDKKKKKTT